MSAVDNELRCNNHKCRTELGPQGRAVVTTCSHIFCVPCANNIFAKAQICPICDQTLSEPDDIVVRASRLRRSEERRLKRWQMSCLNPSSDYKASILAGLTPSLILEVAVRAIGFWTYQTSQESAFQAMCLKNAQDRLANMDKQVNIAHGELQNAGNKIAALEAELETANRRMHDFVNDSREKDREMVRMRANYDKIKRKALLGSTAKIADAINDQVQHSDTSDNLRRRVLQQHNPNFAAVCQLYEIRPLTTPIQPLVPQFTPSGKHAPQPFYPTAHMPQPGVAPFQPTTSDRLPTGHSIYGTEQAARGSARKPSFGMRNAGSAGSDQGRRSATAKISRPRGFGEAY
ncbi:E3 ubiquitin-protein ligase CCNP1IP1, partial [Tremellales sp. Uapishka_1]